MGFHHISWSTGPAAATHIEHLDERLGAGFTLTQQANEDVRVWFDLRTGTIDSSGPQGARRERCANQVRRALPRLEAYRTKKLAALEAPEWGERLELTLEARQAYWKAVVVLKHILPGYCPKKDQSIPQSMRNAAESEPAGETLAGIDEPGTADGQGAAKEDGTERSAADPSLKPTRPRARRG